MSDEKKLAVLIDSDNISAKYAQFIMQEAAKYGTPTYKRIYGDWERGGNGWHDAVINYSILPVQQTCYVTGKNATDFSMIIDAMDILYSGNVDGFVLVTSDSDFTRLAIRLRESGKLVVGIGELKTPRAFTVSCSHYSYLNQENEPAPEYDEKDVRETIVDYVTRHNGERIDIEKMKAELTAKYGNINFSELGSGYKRFAAFVDSIPEVKRSNTFVSLAKKSAPAQKPAKPVPAPVQSPASEPVKSSEVTEKMLVEAISDYFAENQPDKDNMRKIEAFINERYGIIDFSRFGSKRFAKFIDKLPQFTRSGTAVAPVTAEKPAATEQKPAPAKQNPPAQPAPAAEKAPEQPQTKPADRAEVIAKVLAYAAENMPEGGNIGQLNNALIGAYGKNYLADLGFADFKSMLAAVSGVKVRKNHIFAAEKSPAEPESKPTESPAETAEPITPDMNSVRRDILGFAAQHEQGGALAELGALLSAKYGKKYLRELGYSSVQKLTADITGTTIKSRKVFIDPEFAQQTEQIEEYVNSYARSDGSRSLRALSNQLKQKFDGFDFRHYGYDRLIDFVNAIDGVKADRYHVSPSEE
ncbi:MAG: NYN domain-containing protein [Oscillospiraceae bacterium]